MAAFLPSILTSQLLQVKMVGFLAISSLLCSAYVLMTASVDSERTNTAQSSSQREQGLIKRYAIPLNASLTLLVALNAFRFYGRQGVHEGYWALCVVPAGKNLWEAMMDRD